MIFQNTHEPIIPEDEWQLAQCVLSVRRRTDSTGTANPLTGKFYCAECGAKLNNHRSRAKQSERESDDYYDCPTYSQSKDDCRCHYVTTAFIRSMLLQTIQSVSQYAISDEAAFADQVRALSEVRHADEAFMMLTRQYRDANELTASAINSFIDRVIVHAPQKVKGQRSVRIDVVFLFIGSFAVPTAELQPTAEELEEEARRAKEREKTHQKYLRRKERKKKLSHEQTAA